MRTNMLAKIPDQVNPDSELHEELLHWKSGVFNARWRLLEAGSMESARKELANLQDRLSFRLGMARVSATEEGYEIFLRTSLTPLGVTALDALNQGMVWLPRHDLANPVLTRRFWKQKLGESMIGARHVNYIEKLPLPEFADIKRMLVYYITRAQKVGREGRHSWVIPMDDGSIDHARPE